MRNPRLVKIFFFDELSEEDVVYGLDDLAGLLRQSTMPLHIVFEFMSERLPEDLLDIFLESSLMQHDQLGYCVFVRADRFIQFMGKVIRQKLGVHIEFRDSDDDAWDFFNQMGLC